VTRRRPTFWPGQSGNGAPRPHRGDGGHDAGGDHRPDHDDYELGDGEDDVLAANSRLFPQARRGADEPVVKWRSVDRQLYVDAPWRQPDRDYRGTDATEVLHEPDPEPGQAGEDDLEPVYEDAYDDADVDDLAYDDVEADFHEPRYSDAGFDDRPRTGAGGRPRFGRDDDEYMVDRGGRYGRSGRDPRSGRGRYDDALPEPGWKTDSPESVRAALLDSGRPVRRDADRRQPSRWRMALAERLVASWPGQSDSGVPADFPASGEVVMRPRRAAAVSPPDRARERHRERGRDPERPKLVSLSDRLAPDAPLAGTGSLDRDRDRDAGSALGSVARGGGREGARATASVASASEPTDAQGRRLYGVVAAVYAALADPLVNADAATREQQAARFRRFGMMAGSVALAVVLIYAIFPVRTYLEQRSATARARERIDRLTEANAELEERQAELSENETVEEIARRDYQLVFPGEESYGLLPPPVDDAPATTTTTAPPQG
jgi:cell division protein FtsB